MCCYNDEESDCAVIAQYQQEYIIKKSVELPIPA